VWMIGAVNVAEKRGEFDDHVDDYLVKDIFKKLHSPRGVVPIENGFAGLAVEDDTEEDVKEDVDEDYPMTPRRRRKRRWVRFGGMPCGGGCCAEAGEEEEEESMDEVMVGAVTEDEVKGRKLSRESGMRFNVARVQRPLASAAKVVEAGNRISMGPKPEDNYIENGVTGEKIRLRVERGTYVFDVQYDNGEDGSITLDSGAGVSVWPVGWMDDVPMLPKDPKLKMTAANGSVIENLGAKVIRFRGVGTDFGRRA